jgi:hypothetical protein
MGQLDILLHLMGFLAPAAAVALLVSGFARLLMPGNAGVQAWRVSLATNFVAGAIALGAGLWFFGRDGKMLAYAALVLACASSQWVVARGWR